MMEVVLIKLVLAGIVLFAVLNFAGFHTWVERKQSALIQDRIGANRASILGFRMFGMFHALADAVKMFTKEDIVPSGANKTLHMLAPLLSVFFALVAFAVIPFGPPLKLGDQTINLQVANLDSALLFVFAMLSIGAGAEGEALAMIEQLGLRNIVIEAKTLNREDLMAIDNNLRGSRAATSTPRRPRPSAWCRRWSSPASCSTRATRWPTASAGSAGSASR